METSNNIRYIKDRWINVIPGYVAMKHKGEWIYFKRIYYKPFIVTNQKNIDEKIK